MIHAEPQAVVGPEDDVVHVPHETGDEHHRDVSDDESDVSAQDQEVNRAADLPIARQNGDTS